MNNWKETILGELIKLNYGKSLTGVNRDNGSVPVYGSSGITGYHSSSLIKEESLIIGRKGTVGSIYKSNIPFFPIDTTYYIKKSETKCDWNFLYYLLKFVKLERLNFDAVVPGLNREVAYAEPIYIPENINEQKEIAAMLLSLDDEIELLRKQNETLEKIAQTIFKEWFMDFKIDGKKLKLENGIPEGWRIGKIKEIAEIKNGYAFRSEDYIESGVPIIRTTNFNANSIVLDNVVYLSKEKAKEYEKFYLEKFDFLLVMVGASIGKVVIVPSNVLPALQNQNMWNFRPTQEFFKFYNTLLLKGVVDSQVKSASGSAREFFRKDHFYLLDILIPGKNVLYEFNEITGPIFDKVDLNIIQIQTLSRLRDTLLPELMSGKVKIYGNK